MRAVVKAANGPGAMALVDAVEPKAGPNRVLIRVRAVGLCGTDVHIRDGSFPVHAPVIVGHEFVGTVEDAGALDGLAIGQRVVAEPHVGSCGSCDLCLAGNRQMCVWKRGMGWGSDGAAAEFVAVARELIHPVPDSVSDREAVITEPLAVVVSAMSGHVAPGRTVAVVGDGPIGVLSALLARASGADVAFYVTGRHPRRAASAKSLGLTPVVAGEQPPSGAGSVDCVVVAAGASQALRQGITLVKPLGDVIVIGNVGSEGLAASSLGLASSKAARLTFSRSSRPSAWPTALRLLDTKAIEATALVTCVLPLADWSEGLDLVEGGAELKVVLTPDGGTLSGAPELG